MSKSAVALITPTTSAAYLPDGWRRRYSPWRRLRTALAMTGCAGAEPDPEVRRYIEPRTAADTTQGPFSAAVQVGNTLYLSGDIGVDDKLQAPATAEAEATAVLNSIQETLRKSGMAMDDLVYLTRRSSAQARCSSVPGSKCRALRSNAEHAPARRPIES